MKRKQEHSPPSNKVSSEFINSFSKQELVLAHFEQLLQEELSPSILQSAGSKQPHVNGNSSNGTHLLDCAEDQTNRFSIEKTSGAGVIQNESLSSSQQPYLSEINSLVSRSLRFESTESNRGQLGPHRELRERVASQLKQLIKDNPSEPQNKLLPAGSDGTQHRLFARQAGASRLYWVCACAASIALAALFVSLNYSPLANSKSELAERLSDSGDASLTQQRMEMLENPPADLLRFVSRSPLHSTDQGDASSISAPSFGDIIWSNALQSGFARLYGLEENIDGDNDRKWNYLLVILPSGGSDAKPIEAGSFDVLRRNEEIVVEVRPNEYVEKAERFAISSDRVPDPTQSLDSQSPGGPSPEDSMASGSSILVFESGVTSQ